MVLTHAHGGAPEPSPLPARRPRLARRLAKEESGAVLVVTAILLPVLLLLLGFAVDTGTWYLHHKQAQSVADSSALAAANCLANAGSGQTCTSTTDTTDATTVAINYAAQNGATITASNVTFSGTHVTVTDPQNTAGTLSAMIGINAEPTGASATASFSAGSSTSTCTQAAQSAGQCAAIWAANTTCGPNNGFVSNSASFTANGTIHSQGSMNITNGTFTFNSPVTYSSGNCSYTADQSATETGAYSPTAGGSQSSNFWPADYRTFFTACSGSACTGPSATPPYCQYAAPNFSFDYSSHPTGIYCAYGTGTPGDPSTYNGTFSFSNGASIGTSSSPQALTLIGGATTLTSSTVYLQSAAGADGCVIYMSDTDAQAGGTTVSIGNGNYGWSGAIFAPNGSIDISSTASMATFLEAQNVRIHNLTFTQPIVGDGPVISTTGSQSGSDALIS